MIINNHSKNRAFKELSMLKGKDPVDTIRAKYRYFDDISRDTTSELNI